MTRRNCIWNLDEMKSFKKKYNKLIVVFTLLGHWPTTNKTVSVLWNIFQFSVIGIFYIGQVIELRFASMKFCSFYSVLLHFQLQYVLKNQQEFVQLCENLIYMMTMSLMIVIFIHFNAFSKYVIFILKTNFKVTKNISRLIILF